MGTDAASAGFALSQAFYLGAVVADVRSTRAVLAAGGYEMNPLLGEHPSDARLFATSVATTGAIIYGTHRLWHSGHRGWAVATLLIGGAIHARCAMHNRALDGP